MEQQPNPATNQTNIIIVGKSKSVGTAFLLAFLFGPLGLLYASVIGGIVMFFISIVLFILIPVVGAIFAWIGCIIWAIMAANAANDKMKSQTTSVGGNKAKV